MRMARILGLFLFSLLVAAAWLPFNSAKAATTDYVQVSKTVNPASITTEEEAEVTLKIKGTPPVNVVLPNDVILIIDKSGSMNFENKMESAKAAAKGFIDLMDLTKHQVGIVDFSDSSNLFPLTTDAAAAKAYIDTIYEGGGTATGSSIDTAIQGLVNHRPDAQPVIVILTDGDANIPYGTAYQYALQKAQEAKDAGIVFYTIALLNSTDNPDTSGPNNLLKEMATTADHHHFVLGSSGLADIYAAIVKEIGVSSAYNVTISDTVSSNFEIVPDSYKDNIPQPEVSGNTLTWKFAELKMNELTFKYRIRPKDQTKTGSFPVSDNSTNITYTDYAGASRSKAIPAPLLQVNFPAPVINNITPSAGHPNGGETVTITGSKFLSGAKVMFGNVAATTTIYVSSTQIDVVVPPGIQGTATVSVINPDNQKATGTYQYKADPIVSLVEPNNGPLAGGNLVKFTGNYFMNGMEVKFGDIVAKPYFTNPTSAKVYAPAATQPGPVTLTFTNPDGTKLILENAYTYNAPPVVNFDITAITPASGEMAGGESVYLDGHNFEQGMKVFFGDKEAAISTLYSSERIKVIAPSSTFSGAVDIRAVLPSGESTVVSQGYTYKEPPVLPAPTITLITPNNGYTTGGYAAVIDGTNFQQGVKVYFGTVEAVVTNFYSSSRIKVTVPANTEGTVDLKVVNPDGKEALAAGGFTYITQPVPVPAITNISPNSGLLAGGEVVYIDGVNFVQGLKVSFGNIEGTVTTFYSANRIKVLTPAGVQGGAVDVTITNPDGQQASVPGGYTYTVPVQLPLAITSISPNVGSTLGGEYIYIDGQTFKPGVVIHFGPNTVAPTILYSENRMKVKVPANPVEGSVNVTVENSNGETATVANGYTYQAPDIVITQVTPKNGPMAGGTVIYVDGANFDPAMTVTFNGIATPITTYYGSTRIKFSSPASAVSGPVNVVLTNPNGKTGSFTFTYDAPPAVPAPVMTQVNPTYGPVAGGNYIYIDGTGFQQGLTITIGGAQAQVVNFYSSLRIKVKVPAGAAGFANVKITNPDGQQSNTMTYQYK